MAAGFAYGCLLAYSSILGGLSAWNEARRITMWRACWRDEDVGITALYPTARLRTRRVSALGGSTDGAEPPWGQGALTEPSVADWAMNEGPKILSALDSRLQQ